MVRLRMAKYCNLKCMLLILVIYGHWIETDIGSSKLLLIQYKWIYFVHMPLFAFLSGLFLGTERDCKNCVKKLLPMYLLLQTVLWAVNRGNMNWFVPWWHLWYLLSNVLWAGMGWLWFRWKKKNSPGSRSGFWKRMCRSTHGCGKETRDVEKESRHRERRWMIFGISLLAGCVAGYCPFIGRWMSLSRTIVFFPYFWMGLICDPAYDWNKMRKYGMIAFGLAVLLGCHMAPRILASFLYQAGWYGGQAEKGWLRLGCYAIGFGIGCFLLCMIPDRRYFCTKMGADTLPIYLVHAPVVGVLREIPLPWYVELLLSAYLSYFIWKCTQWKGKICGIRSGICTKERRRYRWRHFRTFMKHTENPCIDSFSP